MRPLHSLANCAPVNAPAAAVLADPVAVAAVDSAAALAAADSVAVALPVALQCLPRWLAKAKALSNSLTIRRASASFRSMIAPMMFSSTSALSSKLV